MIDVRIYGAVPDGITDCSSAINAALLVGDVILQNGVFLIEESIKIPSNRTVYGKDAKIKLANNTYDNLFRNSDLVNGNVNVNIIGLGNFVLDGNATNNDDDYATYGKYSPTGYRYVGIQLYKIVGFQLRNLYFCDTMHHTIHIDNSGGTSGNHAIIDNLYFSFKTKTVNQDGIDILWGSSYIDITNIRGNTADDFIGLFAGTGPGDLGVNYETGFNVGNIHDINISEINVKESFLGAFPAIIAGNGNKIYNVAINNITTGSLNGSFLFMNYSESNPPDLNDVYNITADNIIVNNCRRDSLMEFGQSCKDFTFTNIVNNTAKLLYRKIAGTQQNVSINGTVI